MVTVNNLLSIVVVAVFVTVIATFVAFNLWQTANTMPKVEGFGGVARGAGIPDCLRTSREASDLYELIASKSDKTEEGPDDLAELQLILSKLACFKKDLMSPSGIVEATRYQPYNTSHDIEPVSETTARCLAKTIPPRDLNIAFDKWSSRGAFLVKRLCGAVGLTQEESDKANGLFEGVIADVSDVANSQCLVGEILIDGKPGPRDIGGYVTPDLLELREYKGYY
jgi:hypothetical protein